MNNKQNDIVDLSKLFALFWDRKKTIVSSILLFLTLAVIYILFATPIYSANASVQVEAKYTGGALKELSTIFEQESSASTEIAVIKSRAILNDAAETLNLSTKITPKYTIPFFSKGWEKLTGNKAEVTVSHFVPKKETLDKVVLEIGTNPNEYLLFDDSGNLLLQGKVGQTYDNQALTIDVTDLKGESGKRFTLEKLNELKIVTELQKKLSAEEQGKLTGIINLSLNGDDKDYIYNVLNAITESYIKHSASRNTAEAEKSLEFLKSRLPEVRERLSQSENVLNKYRQDTASVDLGLEAKSILDSMVQLEENLNALTIKEGEISQRFKKTHPTYMALLEQRKVLLKEKERLNKSLESLPETQKEVVRLTRDFESDQEIFVQLQNKIQELEVIRSGAVSNARILDKAQVMPDPIAPRKMLILAFAIILGGMAGVALVIFKTLMNKGIKSTQEVRELGLHVYGTVPFSQKQQAISKAMNKNSQSLPLLAEDFPKDLSVEALRSLRTDLSHLFNHAKNNLLMLSGINANAGKGFISGNLAYLLSQTQQRVLLIDADLRKGYLHRLFHAENQRGLADVLAQHTEFNQVTQQITPHLSLISSGNIPTNPSELLSSPRFSQLLTWASANYDVVILAAPPIIAVTDAAVIAQNVATTMLIARFEETTAEEIKVSQNRFSNAGVTINGIILNGLKKQASTKADYFHTNYS